MVSLWVLLWWILSWIQGQFWAGFIFISPLNSSLYIQWFSYSLFVIFSVIYFYFELKKNYVVILDFFFLLKVFLKKLTQTISISFLLISLVLILSDSSVGSGFELSHLYPFLVHGCSRPPNHSLRGWKNSSSIYNSAYGGKKKSKM